MKSQTGQQTIAIHILLIISGRKDNQTMKFGKLVGRTWEILSKKNHTQNVEEKLFPDPFLKN